MRAKPNPVTACATEATKTIRPASTMVLSSGTPHSGRARSHRDTPPLRLAPWSDARLHPQVVDGGLELRVEHRTRHAGGRAEDGGPGDLLGTRAAAGRALCPDTAAERDG